MAQNLKVTLNPQDIKDVQTSVYRSWVFLSKAGTELVTEFAIRQAMRELESLTSKLELMSTNQVA